MQAEFSKEFVGIDFNFSQYIQDNVEEGLSGVKGANSVKIIGPDLATLEEIARAAIARDGAGPGITDLGAFWVLGQPNLNIQVDRAKAARYGLNVSDVNNVVQAALGGTTATTILEADRQFAVVVRLRPNIATIIDEVRNLKVGVQTRNGNAYIPLSELASITLDTGASYIFRERNQRFVPIKFSVRGRDLAGAVAEAQQRINSNVKLPTGYRIDWAGEFEWLQQAKKRLADHYAGHVFADHRAALRTVQFVARQHAGAARASVRGLRRPRGDFMLPDWISASRPRSVSSRCSACR